MTRRLMSMTLTLLLCLASLISNACTQTNQEEVARMQREIDELKANQQQILEQLNELRGDQPAKGVTPARPQLPFDMKLDPNAKEAKGSNRARVAIIEFSDFQCSFCLSYVKQTLPQLDKDYIKTGKVRYFFRNLPLTSGHPNAFRAAEAAHCAAEQGKFWEAHDRFFDHQDQLNTDDWPQHAEALKLDKEKFDQCLTSGKYDEEINGDMDAAQKLGIMGTPAFLIGVVAPDGTKVSVHQIFMGAEPYDSFKKSLDELLAAKGK
jgi:protein-disulfide isomerase